MQFCLFSMYISKVDFSFNPDEAVAATMPPQFTHIQTEPYDKDLVSKDKVMELEYTKLVLDVSSPHSVKCSEISPAQNIGTGCMCNAETSGQLSV